MTCLGLMILAEIQLMVMTHFFGKVKQRILPHYCIDMTRHFLQKKHLDSFGDLPVLWLNAEIVFVV